MDQEREEDKKRGWGLKWSLSLFLFYFDKAGHLLTLVIKYKREGQEIKTKVINLSYDQNLPIFPPENSFKFKWVSYKHGTLKKLKQKLTLGDQVIEAKYKTKENFTMIEIEEDAGKKEKLILPGLVLIKLVTTQGSLNYQF